MTEEQTIARAIAERNELMRRACLSHLAMAERGLTTDPNYTQWAKDFVAMTPPMERPPLGAGEQA